MILPSYKQRNELKFYLPGLSYHTRLALVLGLWAAGLLVQAALGWYWPGAIVIFAGTIAALTHGYSNEPNRTPSGEKCWENVTLDQFKRIQELDAESLQWDRSAWIDVTNRSGCLLALGLVLIVAVATGILRNMFSTQLAALCLMDSAAFLAPFWLTGIRHLYHRPELMIRVAALQNILDRLALPDARGMMAAPMLELQKTNAGDIPQDVKLMVRFDDAPDDFMGIQVQVSLNNVQGTKYPYLYCVILAKRGFGLKEWDYSARSSRWQTEIIVEPDRNPDVDLLVVRQKTSKNSGYHTNPAAQRRVFDAAVQIIRGNLPRHSS